MGDRAQAVIFFNQAIAAVQDKSNPKHLEHALMLFSSACQVDPTWGEAWYQIANNHSDLNQLPTAVAGWRRALQCELSHDTKARTMANLGWRLHNLGKTKDALEVSQAAVALDANLYLGWVNLSCIYQVMNKREEMFAASARAYDLLPGEPVVELAHAFSCLFSRKLAEGLKHFEIRFKYKLKSYLQFPYPKWTGEEHKTIYVDADQGLGDTLSFARFIPEAAKQSKYLHLAVQPELVRLFMHAFVGLQNVNIIPKPAPFPQADYWTTFVSLPFALGLSDEEIVNQRHITAPRIQIPINWKVSDRKLHVGIAWAGSPLNDINVHRSIHVTRFFDLFRVPGVQLYSLQVGPQAQDLYDNHGLALVRDLAPGIRDVVDTVNILDRLDLVICCESALGHIAALAGKECWVPYSYMGRDYRIGLDGKDSFWTPKHRFFPQGSNETWEPVFDRMVDALRERVNVSDRAA